MIIDATNLIAGRLASFVAKKALLGEKVDIVNCEKAVISGDMEQVLYRYKQKKQRGIPSKGPFIPTMPDMFVKRIIRGMLPYKQEKGRKAFKLIKCYIGVPAHFRNEKFETIEKISFSKLPNTKYVRIAELCKLLGAKI